VGAWILIVSTAWQFYATGILSVPLTVSMQEFSSQLACAKAADVVRTQVKVQAADFSGSNRSSVRAICVPKDAK
jgi:hypothetical protein